MVAEEVVRKHVWEMPIIDLLRATEPLAVLATLSVMITFYLIKSWDKKPPGPVKRIAVVYLGAFVMFSYAMLSIIANRPYGLVISVTSGFALFFTGAVLIWYEVFLKGFIKGIINFIRRFIKGIINFICRS